jgi:uncharacterized phage protein (TIGR01671 family)
MRKLKFRVWDNVNYMSTPFTLQDIQLRKVQFTNECVVMQYVGIKDKNGKEVFEGDIVQPYHGNKKAMKCFIKYGDNGFFMAQSKKDTRMDCIWYYDFEIIGNIYENKKLLK